MIDDDRSIGIAVQGQTNVEDGEIHAKRKYRRGQNAQKRGSENPPQQLSEIGGRGLIHEGKL